MKINHKMINKAELGRKLGMRADTFYQKVINNRLTDEEIKLVKDEFIDLFCYLFECDDIKLIYV